MAVLPQIVRSPSLLRAWRSLHRLIDIDVRRLGRPHPPRLGILWFHEKRLGLFRAGDPDVAESVARSQSLLVGFQVLDPPIPATLQGYATTAVR